MLHVVGNLCRDTTLLVDRFPEPGETLVARGSRTGWGGKGLNQAVAAARAGADVVLYAAVGLDDDEAILAALGDETRLTLALSAEPGPSDTSTILVRPDGENLIVSAIARAHAFDPDSGSDPARFAAGDILLMQGNLAPAVTESCLAAARRHGARTVLNPSPLPDAPIDWPMVDHAVLNRGELQHLTGVGDPLEGARRLLQAGAGAVVVTLGSTGALLVDGERHAAVAARPVGVRDTAGAGDVFCGVLIATVACGRPWETALARASEAATLSVTRPGALASCPTAEELARLPALALPQGPR